MINNNTLVSIILLSYNSEKTVLETLESIYNQTYANIELIISDDDSTDQSCKVIREWIKKNKSRFSRVVILDNHPNYGVAKCLNIAAKACHGEWIKGIAADDILNNKCIEWCMKSVAENPEYKFFQGNEIYINKHSDVIGASYLESYRMMKVARLKSAKEQFKFFVYDDVKLSPSTFFEKRAFHDIGGCDETIRNIEDYPLKLRFLRKGYKIGHVNKPTVMYRIHSSVSHDDDHCFKQEHWRLRKELLRKYCYPYITIWRLDYWMSELNNLVAYSVAIKLFRNRNTKRARVFLRVMRLLNPRDLYYWLIKKKAIKDTRIHMS